MNRRIVYTAQIPLSADFLQAQKNALQALGQLAQDVMIGSGTKALISGLACTPTTPASMTVDLGPGSVYQRAPIDGAAFGSLPADTTAVLQQGIATATQNLGGFAAPASSGQSINYLVQAQFRQVDSRPLTLPYYNAANPQVPLIGQNGDGSPQSTDRSGTVAVQVLAGAAAATGSQTTPSPTDGWIPAYVITVAFGQTTLGAGNIAVHPQAPFLASLTSRHHLGLPGTAPKINLATEVEGALPGGVGVTVGQGLMTADDGSIVPAYAGTGSANNPARSDHTHTNGAGIGGPYQPQGSYALASHTHSNDAGIGGPYQAQGSYAAANHTHTNGAGIGGPYQAQGNYALQGHGHNVSEISGMPRLRVYGFLSTSQASYGGSWYVGAYSHELNSNVWTVRLSDSCPQNALILVTPRGGQDVGTSYTAVVRKEAAGSSFTIETFANWAGSTTPYAVSCTFMVFYD